MVMKIKYGSRDNEQDYILVPYLFTSSSQNTFQGKSSLYHPDPDRTLFPDSGPDWQKIRIGLGKSRYMAKNRTYSKDLYQFSFDPKNNLKQKTDGSVSVFLKSGSGSAKKPGSIRIRNTCLYRVSDVGSVTNAFAASAAVVATVPVSALTAATLPLQYQPKQ